LGAALTKTLLIVKSGVGLLAGFALFVPVSLLFRPRLAEPAGGVIGRLDGGAGGGAKLNYQVAGFRGYKISRRWILLARYRYTSVNYRPNGNAQFVYDVHMPGAGIGATHPPTKSLKDQSASTSHDRH
jgi:hypothetical protein